MHMLQPSLFPALSIPVSQVNQYLRELFDSDELLSDLWVQGEISNFARPASGHLYFTLKDATSSLKCVIWKAQAIRLPLSLQNGLAVEVHGSVGIYERDGLYQLYGDAVRLTGEGALYQEYLRLKARLEAEGLFDFSRKRPLPELPARIGIVTSATGAALQDMLNTLRRRYPLAEVVLAPCAVQGNEAIPQIVSSMNALNTEPGIDVILVARGGGSLEDLWAFNDELVVRAIADSQVPVVTGIGHETDFTLSDFAADMRAPTPTAAAELAVPDVLDLQEQLNSYSNRMNAAIQRVINLERGFMLEQKARLERLSPAWQLRSDRQRLDELSLRMETAMRHTLQFRQAEVQGMQKRLSSLNPYAVLQRGYAMVSTPQGEIVRSVDQVKREDVLDIRVADGVIISRVLSDPEVQKPGGRKNDEK